MTNKSVKKRRKIVVWLSLVTILFGLFVTSSIGATSVLAVDSNSVANVGGMDGGKGGTTSKDNDSSKKSDSKSSKSDSSSDSSDSSSDDKGGDDDDENSLNGKTNLSKMSSDLAKDATDASQDNDSAKKDASAKGDAKKANPNTAISGNQWSYFGGSKDGLLSQATGTSYSTTYKDAGLNQQDGSKIDNRTNAAYYGLLLTNMGMDHSFSNGDSMGIMAKTGRLIGGNLVKFGYMIENAVNKMFKLVLDLLNNINILGWVDHGNENTMHQSKVAAVFAPLKKPYQNMMKAMKGLGLVGAVLSFAVVTGLAIFGWKFSAGNMGRTGQGSGVVRAYAKIMLRFFIIIAGPALLASLFAGIISQTQNVYENDNATDYAVYSTLLDFQGWSFNGQLGVPNATSVDTMGNGGKVKINFTKQANKTTPIDHGSVLAINAADSSDGGADKQAAQTVLNDLNATKGDETRNGKVDGKKKSSRANSGEAGASTMAFLSEWTNSSMTKSSDYQNSVRTRDAKSVAGKNSKETYDSMKNKYSTDGSLTINGSNVSSKQRGLSTVGMYNYLNTDFTSSDMTTVTPGKLNNDISSVTHAKVGLVGRGMTAFANFVLMMALVYSIIFLSFFFAWFAINAMITFFTKIFGYSAATMLGSPTYFVKLVIATFTVIVEVVGGGVLFDFSKKILIAFANIGDSLSRSGGSVSNAFLNNIAVHTNNVAYSGMSYGMSSLGYAAITFLEAVLMFWVAAQLIKLRGPILKLFTGMLDNVMTQIFGVLDANAAQNGSTHGQMFSVNRDGSSNTGLAQGQGFGNDNDHLSGAAQQRQGNSPQGYGSQTATGVNSDGTSSSNGPQNIPGSKYNPKGQVGGALAHTPVGKAMNGVRGAQDAVNAAQAKAGKPLTKSQKAAAVAKYMAANAAGNAVKGAGAAINSANPNSKVGNALQNAGQNWQNMQDSSIKDNLAQGQANEQVAKDMAQNPSMNNDTSALDNPDLMTEDSVSDDVVGAMNNAFGANDGTAQDSALTPSPVQDPDANGQEGQESNMPNNVTSLDDYKAQKAAQAGDDAQDGAINPVDENQGKGGVDSPENEGESEKATQAASSKSGAASVTAQRGSIPVKSVSENNRNVKSGLANLHQAKSRVNSLPQNAAPSERAAAQANLQRASAKLTKDRYTAYNSFSKATASPTLMNTAKNTSEKASNARVIGHFYNSKPLTNGQAITQLKNVANAQTQAAAAVNSGDHAAIKQARETYQNVYKQATNAGLRSDILKAPTKTKEAMEYLNHSAADAMNGKSSTYTY